MIGAFPTSKFSHSTGSVDSSTSFLFSHLRSSSSSEPNYERIASAVSPPHPVLEDAKILVVDDKADFRLLAAQFLAAGARTFSLRKMRSKDYG